MKFKMNLIVIYLYIMSFQLHKVIHNNFQQNKMHLNILYLLMKIKKQLFQRDYDTIRKQIKHMKQIHKHNSPPKDIPNRQNLKTPNFPVLAYYNPQIKKEYVPRSTLESNKTQKSNYSMQENPGEISNQQKKIRNLIKSKLQNYQIENKQFLKENRSSIVDKYLKKIESPQLLHHSQYKNHRFINNPELQAMAIKNIGNKIDRIQLKMHNKLKYEFQETLGLSPISITKKSYHERYKNHEQNDIQLSLAQIAKQKLKQLKQKQNELTKIQQQRSKSIKQMLQNKVIESNNVFRNQEREQLKQRISNRMRDKKFNQNNYLPEIQDQPFISRHEKSTPHTIRQNNASVQLGKKRKQRQKNNIDNNAYNSLETKRLSYTPWKEQDYQDLIKILI